MIRSTSASVRLLFASADPSENGPLARALRDAGYEVVLVAWLSAEHTAHTAVAEDAQVIVLAGPIEGLEIALESLGAADIAIVVAGGQDARTVTEVRASLTL
ncbi:hypothetical protein BH09ACT10_BH09ACT10_24520 [soil metagenome]